MQVRIPPSLSQPPLQTLQVRPRPQSGATPQFRPALRALLPWPLPGSPALESQYLGLQSLRFQSLRFLSSVPVSVWVALGAVAAIALWLLPLRSGKGEHSGIVSGASSVWSLRERVQDEAQRHRKEHAFAILERKWRQRMLRRVNLDPVTRALAVEPATGRHRLATPIDQLTTDQAVETPFRLDVVVPPPMGLAPDFPRCAA